MNFDNYELKKLGFDLSLVNFSDDKHIPNTYRKLLSYSLDIDANIFGVLKHNIFDTDDSNYTIYDKKKY